MLLKPVLQALPEQNSCESLNKSLLLQLYVNGELVGGADIVEEMHSKGELKQLLS